MVLSQGSSSSCAATSVRTIRMQIAATDPMTMAFFCCCSGSERAASAMTTALSPDNRMLTQMIWISAIQKAALVTSMRPHSMPAKCRRKRRLAGRARDATTVWYDASLLQKKTAAPPDATGDGARWRRCCLQDGLQQLAHLRRVARRTDAAGLHDLELGIGRVGAARNQGAGVPHALARRRGDAGDEADHGLFHVVLGPLRGVDFVRPANLADHDDGVGVGVLVEHLEHIDVLQAVDGIAADAHGTGLAQAKLGDLCHGFIGQRAGTADDADAALAVDVAGHDADL